MSEILLKKNVREELTLVASSKPKVMYLLMLNLLSKFLRESSMLVLKAEINSCSQVSLWILIKLKSLKKTVQKLQL